MLENTSFSLKWNETAEVVLMHNTHSFKHRYDWALEA